MRLGYALLIASGAVLTAACGSTSTTMIDPTPVRCEVSVSPGSASIGAGGGTTTVAVSAERDCTWSASPQSSWITRVTPTSGQGSGQVAIEVPPNTGAARTGTVVVGEQPIQIAQAAGCTYAVQPTSFSVTASSGSHTANVTTGTGCEWTAASQTSWITVTSGATGIGAGQVVFSVAANSGPQRSGTLTVAGRTITVTQASGCQYTINPQSASFGILGGTGSVTVTAPAGCAWTATESASWIELRSGTSGSGNGTVTYTVSPGFGRRTATITIAGRAFTVTQN